MNTQRISCRRIRKWLAAYVDGEVEHAKGLSEHDFVDHLTRCHGCLMETVAARRVKALLAQGYAHEAPAPEVYQRVSVRLREAGRETLVQWESHSIDTATD